MTQYQNAPEDVVITGLGMLTAQGLGLDINLRSFDEENNRKTQADYKVVGFNPAPHLSDRKVVKVVSHRDVLGLVAFEECIKKSALSSKTINPDRTGLYVGAPPSSCSDHHNYEEAIEASVDTYGVLNEKSFGENFRSASPTTLLTGLPNNVLCYGAKTLDARGPNSNYTTLETSGHMAMIGAMRAMRLGRLDCAIAGGYTAHSDKVFASAMKQRGFSDATPVAEGAVFATMEQRAYAEKRGAKPICQLLACNAASDAIGPYGTLPEISILAELIRTSLKNAKIDTTDIQVIMTTGSGIPQVNTIEQKAIHSIWIDNPKPILATTSGRWGNLMEAGGIADIGFLSECYRNRQIPKSALLSETLEMDSIKENFNLSTTDKKHFAIILRASPWGEYSCLIIKMEAE